MLSFYQIDKIFYLIKVKIKKKISFNLGIYSFSLYYYYSIRNPHPREDLNSFINETESKLNN